MFVVKFFAVCLTVAWMCFFLSLFHQQVVQLCRSARYASFGGEMVLVVKSNSEFTFTTAYISAVKCAVLIMEYNLQVVQQYFLVIYMQDI